MMVSYVSDKLRKLQISISSVQFSCSVVSDSLRPHESHHDRPPCPSPTPRVHSNSSVFSDYLLLPVHSPVLSTRFISWSFSLTRLLTSSRKSFQPLVSRLLHCSCLENSMDRRAWWATVHIMAKSWTQLSN